MAATHTCPGVSSYGRGLNERPLHADGCCARFALMSDERRTQTGQRLSPRRSAEDPPRPAAPAVIDVRELIEVVADLQFAAAQQPDAEPGGTTVWVELTAADDLAEVLALIELGRPYGLVAGWRRVLNSPKGTA